MSEPINVKGFTGTLEQEIFDAECKAYGADPKRLSQVLNHPRFEELAAVLIPIEKNGGYAQLDHDDASHAILLDYYAALVHSIERAFNVETTKRNEVNVGPEIYAAMSIFRESNLNPCKTFEELPPVWEIDGLTEAQTHFNRTMDKYDKPRDLHRFE